MLVRQEFVSIQALNNKKPITLQEEEHELLCGTWIWQNHNDCMVSVVQVVGVQHAKEVSEDYKDDYRMVHVMQENGRR
jgi:hypothetical protein